MRSLLVASVASAKTNFGGFLAKFLMAGGCLTLILVSMPWLIIIGFIMLIIPGLVMMAIPNLFLYAVLFAIAYYPLRQMAGEWPAIGIAALFMIAMGFAIPTLTSIEPRLRFEALKKPELAPGRPVSVDGHVLLVQPKAMSSRSLAGARSNGDDPDRRCNAICAALLFTDGVTAVSVQDEEGSDTFGLRPAGRCAMPVALPESSRFTSMLGTRWAAKLAEGRCIERAGGTVGQPDMRIVLRDERDYGSSGEWSLRPVSSQLNQLEIWRGDTLLLRRAALHVSHLAAPLHITLGGGKENMHLGWGRGTYRHGDREWSFDVYKLLAEHTSIVTKVSAEEGRSAARLLIRDALASTDETLSTDTAAVVEAFFDSFLPQGAARPAAGSTTSEDIELIKQMIADPRFSRFNQLYHALEGAGDLVSELRGVTTARLRSLPDDEQDEGLRSLDLVYRFQPAGAFAKLTPEEAALLDDPERRGMAGSLVARLSDQGEAGVPRLIAILSASRAAIALGRASDRHGQARRRDEKAASGAERGLRILGPKAASALPEIERMIAAGQYREFEVDSDPITLLRLRLGKPVEQFRKPDNLSGDEQRYRDRLRSSLERYDPANDNG